MKKVLSLVVVLVMAVSMMVTVAAAPEDLFIESPSNNSAPIIVDFSNENENCTGLLIITPFKDRTSLSEDRLDVFQEAFDSIRESNKVSDLSQDLDKIAVELNVDPNNLAISDIFDISVDDCVDHDEHGNFTIVLDSNTLENFVALMYYDNGKWHVVQDAFINADGKLQFTTAVPYPFAIVVDAEHSVIDVPETGEIIPWVLIGVIAASATGIIVIAATSRKKRRAE